MPIVQVTTKYNEEEEAVALSLSLWTLNDAPSLAAKKFIELISTFRLLL